MHLHLQVASVFQVRLAAHKALEAQALGNMTTQTLQLELVYNLAATKHVRHLCIDQRLNIHCCWSACRISRKA